MTPFYIPTHYLRALQAIRAKNSKRLYLNTIGVTPNELLACDGEVGFYIPHGVPDLEKPILLDIPLRRKLPRLGAGTVSKFTPHSESSYQLSLHDEEYGLVGDKVFCYPRVVDAAYPDIHMILPRRHHVASAVPVQSRHWNKVAEVFDKGQAVLHHTDTMITFTPPPGVEGQRTFPEGTVLFFLTQSLINKPGGFFS